MFVRSVLRVAAAAAVGLSGAILPATGAFATPPTDGTVTAAPVRGGPGYNRVYGPASNPDGRRSAGTEVIKVEAGPEVQAFCVQIAVDYNRSGSFVAVRHAASGIANIAKAADVAVRHNQIGTPFPDVNLEAAAAQVAIWKLTDGVPVTTEMIGSGDQAFVDRVDALVAAATPRSDGPVAFQLRVSATTKAGKTTAVAHLAGKGGVGIPGQKITLNGHGDAVTGADGAARWTFPATKGGSVSAVWSGTLPAGSVLLPDGVGQAVVTTEPAAIRREAVAKVDTSAPVPSAPDRPAPAPSNPNGPSTPATPAAPATPVSELPYTGNRFQPWVVAGALGAAAAAAWVLRRRLSS